jgi:acyl-CoA dehydrogenase
MALVLNEDQVMLRDAAREFLTAQAPVSHLRELRDSGDKTGFSMNLWREMAEMGWAAIAIPEEFGGLGFGYTGLGVVLEETGRTLSPCPLLSTALLGVTALVNSGNDERCNEWLPKVAAGELLLALAHDEDGRHKGSLATATLSNNNGELRLTGSKQHVADANSADIFIVSALEPEGTRVLLAIERGQTGVRIEAHTTLDNHSAASVHFDRTPVVNADVLCSGQQAQSALALTLDSGRIGAAVEMLGIARESFQRTLDYLRERKQFGVPVGSFQALQHRAAELFGDIELTHSVVLRALQAIDSNDPQLPVLASLAKAKAGETAHRATTEAIQMHGGIGMTDASEIGFFIKRSRTLEPFLGDTRFHLDRYARLKGY